MVQCMGHIQIRNVPDDVHRTLKARAAAKGMSLSEYLLADLIPLSSLPTLEEHVARVRARPMVHFDVPAADLIREDRARH
jgi:antitoxin FitA